MKLFEFLLVQATHKKQNEALASCSPLMLSERANARPGCCCAVLLCAAAAGASVGVWVHLHSAAGRALLLLLLCLAGSHLPEQESSHAAYVVLCGKKYLEQENKQIDDISNRPLTLLKFTNKY